MLRLTIFAGLTLAAAPAVAQPAEEAELAFNNHCRTCHTVKPGDNRLAPSLHGIMGRKAGTVEGYSYSPVFHNSELVWDEASMDRFIENPQGLFPGNNMATFAGLKDAAERAKIIAFLKSAR